MTSLLHTFFDLGQFSQSPVATEHQLGLVILSYAIALLAAYTSLLLLERAQVYQRRLSRQIWLATAAIVAGFGVWSMHFVGMLAWQIPLPMSHSIGLTLVSILPAIIGNAVALRTQLQSSRSNIASAPATLGAGVALGVGIGLMHYTGMAAMELPGALRYDLVGFAISLIVAVVLGMIAMFGYRRLQQADISAQRRRMSQIAVAAVIAAAISGMHYTAMLAARVYPTQSFSTVQVMEHGEWLAYAVSISSILLALMAIVATRIDKQLQKNAQQLRISGQQMYEMVGSINDGVALLEPNGKVLFANQAFVQMLGRSRHDLQQNPLQLHDYLADGADLINTIRSALAEAGHWRGEVHLKSGQTSTLPVSLAVATVNYKQQNFSHVVATLTDLTEQKATEQRMRSLAYHDALTGVANRRALQDKLEDVIAGCQTGTCLGALALFDISKFKLLNNNLGSHFGDALLRAFAERLLAMARPQDRVARLSGNEFAYLMRGQSAISDVMWRDEVRHQLQLMLRELQQPYDLLDHQHSCQIICAATVFSGKQLVAADVMTEASLALSTAKRDHAAKPVFFIPTMAELLRDRLRLEQELRTALERRQLVVYLQPQIDSDGRCVGAEALIRWPRADASFVSPAAFIPIAEETGLIVPLGHYVLEFVAAWIQQQQLSDIQVSVNVSVRQFQRPQFVTEVASIISQYQIQPGQLKFELTESLLLENVDAHIHKMKELAGLGIEFALDDFGTGYSSMSYLTRLPFQTLKIDVSFVRDMLDSHTKAAIVRNIISLAHSLNMLVVAEGVETEAQHDYLKQLGCHQYQGYLFGKPMPVHDFCQYLDSYRITAQPVAVKSTTASL